MKKLFNLALLLLTSFATWAQTSPPPSGYTLPNDPTNKHVIPPSPDTWQFAKYGEYPVSRETGVPNISIPLYTINTGELSLPISLSYHAGGIKVDDIASWVGLGWTLNAGGIVTRAIRGGRPDEGGSGYLNFKAQGKHFVDNQGVFDASKGDRGDPDDFILLMNMKDGIIDSEPDVFNYNVSGLSGKFYLNPNPAVNASAQTIVQGCVSQPKSDNLIQATIVYGAGYTGDITKITITAPDGTRYIFSNRTFTPADGYLAATSWYITQIQSQNGAETINFFYRDIQNMTEETGTETISAFFSGPAYAANPNTSSPRTSEPPFQYNNVKVLDHIDFSAGRVVFNSVDTRVDGHKTRLTSIDIFDINNLTTPIKSFDFNNNDYFIGTDPSKPDNANKRLKLNSVQERAPGNVTLPPHVFTYLESGTYQLPPRGSKAQDYWGYYNGMSTNQTLLPHIDYPYNYWNTGGLHTSVALGTANRNPNEENMKAGIISKIKYPTGGSTEFSFEANSVLETYTYVPPPTPYLMQAYAYNTSTSSKTMDTLITASKGGTGIVQLALGCSAPSCYVHGSVYLKDNGTVVPFSARVDELISPNYEFPFTVVAGHTYELYAHADVGSTAFMTVVYYVPNDPVTATNNKTVGGLRVTDIKNYDANRTLLTQKHYDYSLPGSSTSSGKYANNKLPDPMDFVMTTSYERATQDCNGSFCGCVPVYDYDISMTSHPSNRLGFPMGNVVTYQYVTERDEIGANTVGKILYEYDVAKTDRDFTFITGAFTLDQSWLRGQLLNETYFDKTDNIIKQVNYSYEVVPISASIKGLKVGLTMITPNAPVGVPVCTHPSDTPEMYRQYRANRTLVLTYEEYFSWKRLRSKTETLDGVTTTTTFEYDPLARTTNTLAVQSVDSKNQIKRTDIRYATEMNNTTLTSDDNHIIGIPLESDEKVNGILTGGTRLTYGALNGLIVPSRFEKKLADGSYEILKDIIHVNAGGRITEYKTNDGVTNSLMWGYSNQYPTAQVVNAMAQDIFYDSFEEAGGTADSNSKTGSKVGTATYSKTLSPLSNGNYDLTYWKRTSGTWGLVTTTVAVTTGSYTISITADATTPIDEVRFKPSGAQMTTYTYQSMIGMMSATDANNASQYYEYDSFMRLKRTKDLNGNIVKAIDYHYKGN